MKGKRIIIILIIINILSMGVIYNLLKKDNLNNEKIIVKAMTEGEYEDYITSLNQSHMDYANYIQESKKKIANAITNMGVETSETADVDTMVTNISDILQVKTMDATSIADNISKDKTAYVNGELITGTGGDNDAFYSQGFIDGQKNATENLNISYTYHEHAGSATDGSGCYNAIKYHKHSGSASSGGGCYTVANIVDKYVTCTHFSIQTGWNADGTPYGYVQSQGSTGTCWLSNNKVNFHGAYTHNVKSGTTQNGWKVGCGKNESTAEGYTLGCGKTTETIESATITY